jgi:hypothetical protein
MSDDQLTDEQGRPAQWVIVGAGWPTGGVALVASNTVVGNITIGYDLVRVLTGQPHDLQLRMKKWVLVRGDTYRDALRKLFDEWDPGGETGPVELPPGDQPRQLGR